MTNRTLDKVVCVSLDTHIWTARKKLRPEDLQLSAGALPPEDVASLGSKRVFDPKKIAIFLTLRRKAHRVCETHGVRFLGGYAIPRDRIDQVGNQLDQVVQQFEAAKTQFLRDYDTDLEGWLRAHPGWEHVIRSAVESVCHVKARLSFDWQAFQVNPPQLPQAPASQSGSAAIGGLERATRGLAGQLFREAAETARSIYDERVIGREKVPCRLLASIKRLADKLDGLAFLDATVGPLVAMIRGVMAAIPSTGASLEGRDLAAIGGLLLVLGDEARMKAHAARVLSGESVDEVVEEFARDEQAEEALPPEPTAEPAPPAATVPPRGPAIREQPEEVFSFF
jgi:hypothetical protein